jgi:aspartyl-tRNA synthetase
MMRTHYASQVTRELAGQKIRLAGWVHEVRELGNLAFLLLRDRTGLVQLTVKKKEASPKLLEALKGLVKETAIVVEGTVSADTKAAVGRELFPNGIEVVGKVHGLVPFEVTGKVPADLDTRLNSRFIDLRRRETNAVFRVRHEVQRAFREKLYELDFQEANPPCIVGSATEGGTELFPVIYFEKTAYLAQSPQLYKQLAVQGGIDRVFMITPVFRAEKHNTIHHLNEITQMDAEMGFANGDDAMDVLSQVFTHVLRRVSDNRREELELLGAKVAPPREIRRHTYTEAIEKLRKAGAKIEWGEDFSKEHEKKLFELLGEETFILKDWPAAIKPFYAQPHEENGDLTHAYDLFYRGLEMASGTQRVHDPELLTKKISAKGLNPKDFESYINAFRYGGIPHAGWSIGSERLTMALLGLANIREAAMFPRDRTRLHP